MSTYMPGMGLKKPLNMLEGPIYPGIKKQPPRFSWSRRHWTVDTGTTLKQVEHVPSLQENAVLFQSRDAGEQFLYGKAPTYTTFVNKEFRPPPIDRDDVLPLSRIPRPVVIPRLNPGTANSSNTAFAAQNNIDLPEVEGYLTDRVKSGDLRPTFYAPISMPEDNTVLPDLEVKIPHITTDAGYRLPDLSVRETIINPLPYKQLYPEVATGARFPTFNSSLQTELPELEEKLGVGVVDARTRALPLGMDGVAGREIEEFGYNRPQVAANSQRRTVGETFTPLYYELEYSGPQVAATAGERYTPYTLIEGEERELDYSRPQVAAFSGYHGPTKEGERADVTPLEEKIEATQSFIVPNKAISSNSIRGDEFQEGAMRIGESRPYYAYEVHRNLGISAPDVFQSDRQVTHRPKASALGGYHSYENRGYIPQSGISNPQLKIKSKR